MSFGAGHFGSSRFGSGDVQNNNSNNFNLLEAEAITKLTIKLTFDDVLDTGLAALVDPASYSISGGLVVSYVELIDVMTVLVHLYTEMQPNKTYTITLSNSIKSLAGTALFVNSATFLFFEQIRLARRVSAKDHWNPGFGIAAEGYDDI